MIIDFYLNTTKEEQKKKNQKYSYDRYTNKTISTTAFDWSKK